MRTDFFKGMGSINLFPSIPEYKPIALNTAYENVGKSFEKVAKIMNSVIVSETKKGHYAKTK